MSAGNCSYVKPMVKPPPRPRIETRSAGAIRRELHAVIARKDMKLGAPFDPSVEAWIMYGAEQALAWVLKDDAAAPHTLAGR